jgi:hypothetical protein
MFHGIKSAYEMLTNTEWYQGFFVLVKTN